MASAVRPLVGIAARPQSSRLLMRQSPYLRATSHFHTSTSLNATPYGQPPKNFRLPRPKRFDEGEGAIDKATNYFLLTEMLRGMYVVMEQFFRPPYGNPLQFFSFLLQSTGIHMLKKIIVQLHHLLPLRKRSHISPLPWRTCPSPVPLRRRTLHCL